MTCESGLFRYLEEARDGRRRYLVSYGGGFSVFESLSELDGEIRRFIKAVHAQALKDAEDQ